MQTELAMILTELSGTLGKIPEKAVEQLADAVLGAKRVFAAGAGRSGLAARGFAMRLMHMGLAAFVCGETVTPAFGPGDLLLVVSGSGSTSVLVNMAEKVRRLGGRIALVTTQPESPIGRLAALTVEIHAPTRERMDAAPSVQPMGTLFEQCSTLFLDAAVLRLMARTGCTAAEMAARHANLE